MPGELGMRFATWQELVAEPSTHFSSLVSHDSRSE
jgi:hypothetical protein